MDKSKIKKEKINSLKSLYDNELVDNTVKAYINMEKIGFISKKELLNYKKILKIAKK